MVQVEPHNSVIEVECLVSTSEDVRTARTQRQQPSVAPSDSAVIQSVASTPTIGVGDIMGSSPKPNSEVVKSERKVPRPHFTLFDWWWELLSWMIGTLSLLTMLLLLTFFHNKSTTTWRSKLSINAIVSALAQTSQTSLAVSLSSGIGQLKWDWLRSRRQKRDIDTFDDASRGPLGSLNLIWRQLFGTMSLHVATVGALTAILLVTFSTFSQQAIGISERKVQSKNGARIARANNFTETENVYLSQMPYISHGAVEGVFRDNISISEVQGHCPGERCVWEKYNSLAICAHTTPLVRNANFTCTVNYTGCILNEAVDPAYNTTYLQEMAQIMNDQTTRFQMSVPPDQLISAVFDSVDIYIAVGYYREMEMFPIDFLKVTFEVCIHTYQTAIHGLQIETKLLRQGPALTKDPNWLWIPDQENSRWLSCGMVEDISACVNIHNFWDTTLLLVLVSELLSGNISENPLTAQMYSEITAENGFERIAARMNNVAVSMTNGMRRSPHTAEMVDGIVENLEPYFRVSIPWLILPMVMWLSTSIFLLFTILLTKWHGVPVWKSSPLILLDCKQQDIQLDSDRLNRKREKRQPAMVVLEDGRLVESYS